MMRAIDASDANSKTGNVCLIFTII